ncbi:MAG: hypothetical protein JST21_14325 [Bacteroidetes bacterium]|nr:hypothetical protein [Bacteroidota bacterium]
MFSDFYHSFYYALLIVSALMMVMFIRTSQRPFRLLAALVILTLLSELIARFVSFGLHTSNNIVYHFFTPVEFTFYVLIYRDFFHSKKWDLILWICLAGFIVAEIFNTFFFQPLSVTNTNTFLLESVLLIIFSLSLFIRIREAEHYENLWREGVFWFNCVVLLYYSMSLLVWGFHSIKVYQLKNPPMIIYNFLLICSGLLYATYTIAVGLNFSNQKQMIKHA